MKKLPGYLLNLFFCAFQILKQTFYHNILVYFNQNIWRHKRQVE